MTKFIFRKKDFFFENCLAYLSKLSIEERGTSSHFSTSSRASCI